MVPATLRNPSGGRRRRGVECQTRGMRDLVIHVPNEPGALAQVAVGRLDHVTVFGDDYPTPDGTGVRDYIHVVDLAEGHLAALGAVDRVDGAVAVNLGTGAGSSVLDVIRAASKAVGRDIPYEVGPRRPGDIAAVWAEPGLARELLGWAASRTLEDMCADHWRWQASNPDGYSSASVGG